MDSCLPIATKGCIWYFRVGMAASAGEVTRYAAQILCSLHQLECRLLGQGLPVGRKEG